MRNAEKIMNMSPVSILLWLVQLLTACASHHNATSTHGQDEVTNNAQLTTENKMSQAVIVTTVPSPVEEFLTWTKDPTSTMQPSVTRLHANTTETQRSSTNAEGMEKLSITTSHPDHRFVSSISSNPTSTAEENRETGTRSAVFTTGFKTEGFTNQEIVDTAHETGVNNWESGTSLQTEHTVQSTSWTEERSKTKPQTEADGTTMSLVNFRNMSKETQSDKGSYNSTFAQHGQTHTTATLATTPFELDNKTSLANNTNGYTNVLPSSKHGVGSEFTTGYYVETPEVVSVTQATSSNSENISSVSLLKAEGPLLSNMSANTFSSVSLVTGTDQKNVTTTVHNVVHTTWTDSVSTPSPLTSEGSFTTMEQNHSTVNYNTTQTELEIFAGNHTTPGNNTAGMIKAVSSSEHDLNEQMKTENYITTHVTQATSSEGKNVSTWNVDEPLISTTSSNPAVSASSTQSTPRNMYGDTYSTRRDRITETEAKPTPSLSFSAAFPVNMTVTPNDTQARSRNVSREAEQTVWLDCFSKASSSKTHRSSKLICFITLWSLGMTASIFLGLTVFLWVRLSVVRKKAKSRYGGVKSTGKERQSLWATHTTPAEERVEFWYANGSTLEADEKVRLQERAKRNGGKQKEEKDGDMWIQPKVTTQDIAEFWYANRRGRNEDRMEMQQSQL